jgi:hypothetical protein
MPATSLVCIYKNPFEKTASVAGMRRKLPCNFCKAKLNRCPVVRGCFYRIGISLSASQAAKVKLGATVNRRPFFIRALADSRCKDEHFFKPPCLFR